MSDSKAVCFAVEAGCRPILHHFMPKTENPRGDVEAVYCTQCGEVRALTLMDGGLKP